MKDLEFLSSTPIKRGTKIPIPKNAKQYRIHNQKIKFYTEVFDNDKARPIPQNTTYVIFEEVKYHNTHIDYEVRWDKE